MRWLLRAVCWAVGHLDHDVEGVARSTKGFWVEAPCRRCGGKRLEMAPKHFTLGQWPAGRKPTFKETTT